MSFGRQCSGHPVERIVDGWTKSDSMTSPEEGSM